MYASLNYSVSARNLKEIQTNLITVQGSSLILDRYVFERHFRQQYNRITNRYGNVNFERVPVTLNVRSSGVNPWTVSSSIVPGHGYAVISTDITLQGIGYAMTYLCIYMSLIRTSVDRRQGPANPAARYTRVLLPYARTQNYSPTQFTRHVYI